MRLIRLVVAAAVFGSSSMSTISGQSAALRPEPAATTGPFSLTVDSIMRGPDLVGYPPTGLRWSADSQQLYFEWRKPGEREASTYVVGRNSGEPRKLSEDEARNVPPANGGRWDAAHKRVLFVDDGDVVMVDATSGVRRQITRTTGNESNPRWARKDTAVTYVRDGNLFAVSLENASPALVAQLTDVGPKKPEPRLTDSQKFIRDEEEKLIGFLKEQREEKKRDEEKDRKRKLPALELQDRQSAVDLQLAPDNVHVFVVVAERPAGAKNTIVPNYVTDSGYTEDIQGRTNVGDTQDRRLLAILNLETGKTAWADATFAPPVVEETKPAAPAKPADDKDAPDRPTPAADAPPRRRATAHSEEGGAGRAVVDAVAVRRRQAGDRRRAIRRQQGSLARDDRSGDRQDEGGRSPARRCLGARGGRPGQRPGAVPARHAPRLVSLRARRVDASLHAGGRRCRREAEAADQRQVGNHRRGAVARREEVLPHHERGPSRRAPGLHDGGGRRCAHAPDHDDRIQRGGGLARRWRARSGRTRYSNKPPEVYVMPNTPGATARQVTTTPTAEWRSFKWIDPKVITFKARDGVDVYARLFTPEMINARRDPTRPAVVFVHGAGYAQNAHRYWASYFREYMFHNLLASRGYVVLDVDYRASSGYGRDWRTAIYRHMGGRTSRTSSTARSTWSRRRRSIRSGSGSTAAATAASSR